MAIDTVARAMAAAAAQSGGGEGTSNYNQLTNKPKINGHELSGNKTTSELGLEYDDTQILQNIETLNEAVSEHDREIQNVDNDIDRLDAKISEMELYKFPNAIIHGTPTINQGQVSNFTRENYLSLPSIFDLHDRGFEFNFAFRTGNDVTTAQNIIGSRFCMALLIESSKLKLKVSQNGSSWDLVDIQGNINILPNTTYYVQIYFDKLTYKLKYSLDGVEYTEIASKVASVSPNPSQIYLGVGNNFFNPFSGIINLNKCYLKVNNSVIWQGMDDAGLSTRMATDMENIDEAGIEKIKEIVQPSLNDKQNKLTSDNAGDNVTITEVDGIVKINSTGGGTGTSNYNDLANKPKINGVELNGNKSLDNLMIQEKLSSGTNIKTINGTSLLGAGNIDIQSSNINPWTNKVISIMGDSISTYTGWIPQTNDGHNLSHVAYYPRSTFNDVTKTWWHSLISDLGAKLGVNESWSGSYVGNTSDSEIVTGGNNYGTKCAMASNTRIENLGSNGTPDLILVYGGTNDIWSGNSRMGEVVPGTFDSTAIHDINPSTLLATKKWTSFADAFRDMLLKMMYYYPQSRIVVLFPFYADSTGAYSHAKLDEFIELQRNICDYFGINYIDMRACGINVGNNAASKNKEGFNTILTQNVHPNYEGMALMKNYIKARLLSFFETDRQENVIYSVTNNLSINTNADRYIKAVSAGKSYKATITGSSLSAVKVFMNDADVTSTVYNSSTGVITIASCTGNIIITEGEVTVYSINTSVSNGSHSGATQIISNGTANVTITANPGYRLPNSITVTGATYTYNKNTGVVVLSNPTGNVNINVSCVEIVSYSITTNVTNGTFSGATSIIQDGAASVAILPSDGFVLPQTVSVTGATYTYDNSTGTINLSNPTSNVIINAECVETASFSIVVNGTNGTYTGDDVITEGRTANVILQANEGYKLPDSITVTGAEYTYDSSTGIIVLSNPTSDISISFVCEELVSYTITTTVVNGTYSGDAKIFEEGTASINISANTGYILPTSITVTGAEYEYNSNTGLINLSNPTSNININAECVVKPEYTWYSEYYDKNPLNAIGNLAYAGFAYKVGEYDSDGMKMNAVRLNLHSPGLMTFGKVSSDYKTIIDSEQVDVTGDFGDVKVIDLSKTYTLENGEHFFINAPSGDTGLFRYSNRNAPATVGIHFMTKVGTTSAQEQNNPEAICVDFGYKE